MLVFLRSLPINYYENEKAQTLLWWFKVKSINSGAAMNTTKLAPTIILFSVVGLSSIAATAQTVTQEVNVTIRPPRTAEERVAEEVKLKELRRAAEEKLAAEESARVAETNPKNLLRRARVMYVTSSTSFFESVQLQNELRKRDEFDRWEMAIVGRGDKYDAADIVVEIDRPIFTHTFTYQITNRSNGIVLATGKITAIDGNVAAPKLAARIMEEIRLARGEVKAKK
ncbi:MAG: hypothetical protein DMF69_18490 [Acidobacteria bacterium]|nr:MAG: hypothetical protein DMF69_18490 [Acidobacteriota bacterium]